MSLVDKTKRAVGTASAIAVIVQTVARGEWNQETGQLDKVWLFGMPLFDRARGKARRARRKARRG